MEYMRLNNLVTKKRDLFSFMVLEIQWAVPLRDFYKELLWMVSPWWPLKLEVTW